MRPDFVVFHLTGPDDADVHKGVDDYQSGCDEHLGQVRVEDSFLALGLSERFLEPQDSASPAASVLCLFGF